MGPGAHHSDKIILILALPPLTTSFCLKDCSTGLTMDNKAAAPALCVMNCTTALFSFAEQISLEQHSSHSVVVLQYYNHGHHDEDEVSE